ncbi:hypothetical protein [Vallitalea okinawensis]|uniref:hypothetical protein n=1 Tax=Vallitalea okinawensis TaxID=2078660 RepID=UPI00130096E0|nr:hypothetical protein [Vallitalea okinawensis]
MSRPIVYRRISRTLNILACIALLFSMQSTLFIFLAIILAMTSYIISVLTWICPNCECSLSHRRKRLYNGMYCPHCGFNIKA